ncbi:MAG: hypothetical protein C4555_03185 [Dehalococcoidia bacterium]|nr:MAG: hypothetical protein C4555_03185 [Dehalococcoidia bacterium]
MKTLTKRTMIQPGEPGLLLQSTSFCDGAPPAISPIVLIPLRPAGFAIIDPADYELISPYKWSMRVHKSGHIYAATSFWKDGRTITLMMHRVIMNAPKGVQVDHLDDNGLNNKRGNLRIATYAQNQQYQRISRKQKTASRYKGVCRHKSNWRAQIRIEGRKVWLGDYRTEIEAAMAYDKAAVKHFGEFARPNLNGHNI